MNHRPTILLLAFSLLCLIAATAAAAPHAFPVPFVAKQHQEKIWFTELPGTGKVEIFTINGEEVVELPIPSGSGQIEWNVTNSSGKKVATGVYLYRIEGNGEEAKGKLVIIR